MLLEKTASASELHTLLDAPQRELPSYFADTLVQGRVGKYLSDLADKERIRRRELKVLAEVARRSGDAGQSHWE